MPMLCPNPKIFHTIDSEQTQVWFSLNAARPDAVVHTHSRSTWHAVARWPRVGIELKHIESSRLRLTNKTVSLRNEHTAQREAREVDRACHTSLMTRNQCPNPHEKPNVVLTLSILAFLQLDGRWAQEDSLDVHGSTGLEY